MVELCIYVSGICGVVVLEYDVCCVYGMGDYSWVFVGVSGCLWVLVGVCGC